MTKTQQTPATLYTDIDADIAALSKGKDGWARSSIQDRMQVLNEVKDALMQVSQAWADIAARKKQIPEGSPLKGEEWTSGPYAVMSACNGLLHTLGQMQGKKFLDPLKKRETATGQIAVRVVPSTIWDHLLMSGVTCEVWMEKGVTADNLAQNTARAYDRPANERHGKIALVLGAGNIASIAPMDCFHKLFLEHHVVVLKMNPVNDYLTDILCAALKPLIDRGALRIVKGGGDVGEYLTNHPDIDELHITGAESTHDAIIWGTGEDAKTNKAAGTPRNTRPITSELGAVCPTIVVPGPWTAADIQFQAEHIATQKMHNSGFNCIACQTLILPKTWDKRAALMTATTNEIAKVARGAYYPGVDDRLHDFAAHADTVTEINRASGPDALVVDLNQNPTDYFQNTEVFAPALGIFEIDETDPAAYLEAAVAYANDRLHGTLGANILIHPTTKRRIGKQKFETLIGALRYGTIAVNAWAGLGFLMAQCPWGAFPGHRLDDVQSGIGFVHNSFMFDRPERSIITAPWRPFPRGLLSGQFTLLPKPPWFVTNKSQHKTGKALTQFQHRPSWRKLPRILISALSG